MIHRTKPTGVIKFATQYNGRKIIFGFDRDFVFVNCVSFEDGSDVSCEDVIQCICEIHRDHPEVAMVDGTGSYYFDHESKTLKEDGNGPVYGNGIVFDSSGHPIVKVVDDVIYSAYNKCVCDYNYPASAFVVSDSGHHPFNDYIGAWKAMEKAVKEGKVKSIGLSNFEGKHWQEILDICTIKPAILQIEGHPYFNQKNLKERSEKIGTLIETWYPVGHGDKKMYEEPIFVELGKKYNKTPVQIILRWHIDYGYIPLPKSCNPQHIKENFEIFDFKLTDEEMKKISELPQKRYVNTPENQIPGSKFEAMLNSWKPNND